MKRHDFDDLAAFVIVAEESSFTRGAAQQSSRREPMPLAIASRSWKICPQCRYNPAAIIKVSV